MLLYTIMLSTLLRCLIAVIHVLHVDIIPWAWEYVLYYVCTVSVKNGPHF